MQVGDRVRMLEIPGIYTPWAGEVGKIERMVGNACYVWLDNGALTWVHVMYLERE